MRLRHAVSAGLVDAGLASLATFAMGVVAARSFEPDVLGSYALFFAAFTTAIVLPRELVFVPLEILALGTPADKRLGVLRRSLPVGSAAAILPAVVASAVAAAVATAGDTDVIVGLAVTAGLSAFISPVQDHVRRMFHLAGSSWHAAAVSAAQLVGVLLGFAGLDRAGVPIAWIPFGGLAIANFISLTLALAMSRGALRRRPPGPLHVGSLARQGSWLTVLGLLPEVTGFLVAGVVVHLAGSAVLGFAEAARIVSRPVTVTARGLSAAIGPRAMESALSRDEARANRTNTVFFGLVIVLGAGYALIAGFDWPANVMAALVPAAYDIRGLALVSIVAVTVESISVPYRFELIASRSEAKLTSIETLGNTARLGLAALASSVGAFVVPIGTLLLGGTRLSLYRRPRSRIYHPVPHCRRDP